MVIDSSALLAVLFAEPGAERLLDAFASAERKIMSAVNRLEAEIVMAARKGDPGSAALARFMAEADIEVIAFDSGQSEIALDAWRRFGKGRHPAALNMGDCAAYALARLTGQALLCTGEDFARTDLAIRDLAQ
jgi:ribonuclease VapC